MSAEGWSFQFFCQGILDGFWEFAFLAKDVAECGDGEEAGNDFGSVHHPPKGNERVALPKEFVQHESDGSRQDSAKFGEGMFYRDGDRFRVITANPELTDPHHFLSALRATKRHSAFPLYLSKTLPKILTRQS
jgi:hypothetical protein